MRLRRLHLRRYGGFADAILDLPRPEGADVTVVLGANEAGKSTAFAAWLDLLFGIPMQTQAAWRFERKDLEIAAEIETGGATRMLQRLPTRTDDLRDGDGSVVVQGEVDALLHALDRDSYRSRFSLDRGMLESGGRDIAAGKGDLGALLFAGMAGLPGVQDALVRTQSAADSFFRIEGRRTKSTALGAGLAELKEGEAALKARLTPEVQARHDLAVTEAEGCEAEAQAVLASARRSEACERDAILLRERDGEFAAIEAKLAGLPRCTWSPEEAEAARAALAAKETAIAQQSDARVKLEAAAETLARRHTPDPNEGVAASVLEALEAMVVDDVPVLSRLGPVNDEDLARITDRRRELGIRIADARATLGLQVPAAGLAERIEPALRAVADARAAKDRAARNLQRTSGTLAGLAPVPDDGDAAGLREALDTLRKLDVEGLRRDRDTKAAALEALGRDAVPDHLPDPHDLRARVARHHSAVEALAVAERAEVDASTRLDARRRIHADARDAATGGDAAAAEAARQDRDMAWHHHRTTLDAASADAFSDAMATHDRLVAGLAEGATRAEAARAAARDAAEAEAAHTAAVRTVDEARTALADCDLTPVAEALGLRADSAPDALAPRLDCLREIARAAPLAARAEEALVAAQATQEKALGRLRDLLPEADDPEAAARAHLLRAEAAAEARGRREAAVNAHEAAVVVHDETQGHLTEAEQKRDAVLTANGLDALDLSALATLRTLAADEEADARDARRQEGLSRARDAARSQIERLTNFGDFSDPIAFARARMKIDASAAQARLEAATAHEAARSALAAAEEAVRRTDEALARALDGQGGEGPAAARVAALSEAARLVSERATLLREIETIAGRHDEADLDAARALPPDPARLGALTDAIALAEADHRAAIAAAHDARRARDEAQGGDASAHAVQARATILVDLRQGARDAAAALLGHMAGQAALERLVRDNRGAMVAAASEAFRRVTGGEWDGLEVFGPGGMTLAARRGDRRVNVDRLSEGTRAQLFLSLRVAGHAAFCERHGPLPFVTDDILEAFDDTRAEAALRMAGEMGAIGQVVFLTHHPHIAALAKRAIPGVSVIDMPRQG